MALFNVRVYGLLVNDEHQILISDEKEYGMLFSKFPGGGLEYGEGLIDGLKREFMEECNMPIEVIKHFYTTDYFVKSLFGEAQLISVYYLVKNIAPVNLPIKTKPFDFDTEGEVLQAFRWASLEHITPTDVTFPIDKHVVELLNKGYEFS
ncbi:NUDIX domain-containing protein [Mucilaginibacter gracilis]|uniref:NUDIX domain-containing protein n=1 Tax=Mucilaginibacter gracilis TaxID=423350 RepID=A0A495J7P0_9SPHI|nr:NUDIX domain-containing protein [Mucilaginibacter gracilis]RKR85005.1 NUDIX domain-containing protein [Mucilaginibacter gracilis]